MTLRIGDVFLKVDADPRRTDVEVEAMTMAPVPTPEILWRKPPALALAALPGKALGRLADRRPPHPRRGSPPVPPSARCTTRRCRPGLARASTSSPPVGRRVRLARRHEVLPADVVTRNRRLAETALGPGLRCSRTATCISNMSSSTSTRSPASSTGPRHPRATCCTTSPRSRSHTRSTLTTSSPATGCDVDRGLIRAWWSFRCLVGVRWLFENGYGAPEGYPEVAVLRSVS